MNLLAPSDEQLTAIREALLEGTQAELAAACDPRVPDGVALVVLPHGVEVAEVAFGTRAEIARELAFIAADEGPAAFGLERVAAALLGRAPPGEGALLCVVVVAGRGGLHEIRWPRVPRSLVEA